MSDDMLAYLLDLCNEAFRSEGWHWKGLVLAIWFCP